MAGESYSSETLCTHRQMPDCYTNNFVATDFLMLMLFNELYA